MNRTCERSLVSIVLFFCVRGFPSGVGTAMVDRPWDLGGAE